MNVVVLTSRENFVWHSMQEIIPYVEKNWVGFANDEIKVTVLNVDEMALKDIIPFALQATHLVLTCFNFRVFKVACFIREELALPMNFIYYVHNMATIAFWPFRNWSSTNFFKKNDLFISSCQNDSRTIKAVFSSPRVVVIPFYFLNPVEKYLNKAAGPITEFVYVGRISPQKNLHNLILAYAILKNKNRVALPKLNIFGKEDDLGSPNMSLKQTGYRSYLYNLVAKLGLSNDVNFKGHVDRKTINDFLSANTCLSISPSLHSDENFGMAILQSLVFGNHCLISDWGGHSDFKKYFSKRTTLMKVTNSNWGPVLSAETIAESIEESVSSTSQHSDIQLSPHYLIASHFSTVYEFLKLPYDNENLKFSLMAENIYTQKNRIFSENPMQIFSDYCDPLFHEITAYYIGSCDSKPAFSSVFEYKTVPWVELNDTFYRIKDPHKGNYLYKVVLQELFDGGYLINEKLEFLLTR